MHLVCLVILCPSCTHEVHNMKCITSKIMANSALKGSSFVAFSSNTFSYLFNSISRPKSNMILIIFSI